MISTTEEQGFLTRLRQTADEAKSIISLGIDPVIASLPDEHRHNGIQGFANFMEEVFSEMKSKGILPGMIKPNLGFYAIHDNPFNKDYSGSNALVGIMNSSTHLLEAQIPVALDNKTGDIGKSSANWAQFGYRLSNWGAHAVTVHFDMGTDSVEPYIKYCNPENKKGLYIMNKTSNPGSKDFQMAKMADGRFLYEQVGDKVLEWAVGHPGVGVVIGGNSLEELRKLLAFYAGKDIAALVPGVGDQGGKADEVANVAREVGFELALLRINSSSKITHPWYSEKEPDKAIPSLSECVAMCVESLRSLNEQVKYIPKAEVDELKKQSIH